MILLHFPIGVRGTGGGGGGKGKGVQKLISWANFQLKSPSKLGKFSTNVVQKIWGSKLKSDRYLYILDKTSLLYILYKDKNLMYIVLDEDIQNSIPKTFNKPYYLLISKSNPI